MFRHCYAADHLTLDHGIHRSRRIALQHDSKRKRQALAAFEAMLPRTMKTRSGSSVHRPTNTRITATAAPPAVSRRCWGARCVCGDTDIRPAAAEVVQPWQQPARCDCWGDNSPRSSGSSGCSIGVPFQWRSGKAPRKRRAGSLRLPASQKAFGFADEDFATKSPFQSNSPMTDCARRHVQFLGSELETLVSASRLKEMKGGQWQKTKRHQTLGTIV